MTDTVPMAVGVLPTGLDDLTAAANLEGQPAGARALLGAFEEVAREQGLRNVGLREVARRAELSHGAPAHFFGSFDGMVHAFAAWAVSLLGAAVERSREATSGQPGPDRLVDEGVAVLDFALAHPVHFDVLFRPGATVRDEVVDSVRDQAFHCFHEVVEAAVHSGEIGPSADHSSAMRIALELWATTIGLCSMLLDDVLPGVAGPAARDAAIDVMTQQIQRMTD